MANGEKTLSHHKKIQIIAFLGIVLIMLVLVALMLKPLANILLFSGILAVIFRPFYNALLKRFKNTSAAAGVVVFVVLTFLVLFIWGFGQLLFNEIADLSFRFKSGEFVFNRSEIISQLPSFLQDTVRTLSADINSVLGKAASGVFQSFSTVVSNLASFFFSLFIAFFAFYYLLKDGSKLKYLVLEIAPISGGQENLILEKIIKSVNGVVKGTFLVALTQSIIALIGFIIFGVPNPLLWAMCTFVAAFIPNIGTAIVMIPAVAYVFLTGHTGAGIGLTIWAVVAVGLIDNILSPKLVGRSAQLHPLLVLLSVIGGLQLFGFLGFLLGPIFMAVFVALIEMYTVDFKEYLQK